MFLAITTTSLTINKHCNVIVTTLLGQLGRYS